MNILKDKNIAVLGLGMHGGGETAVRFAHYNRAGSITIIDRAFPEKQEILLRPLEDLKNHYHINNYDHKTISQFDLVIKNPAIQRKQKIISCIKKVETDISLFYQYRSCASILVTGTKGKSSVSTALHNLLQLHNQNSSLCGNITFSPLNLILQAKEPSKIVLELSSFQIGDLSLINKKLLKNTIMPNFTHLILTNILPDHQNYYNSQKKYVADKFFIFQRISKSSTVFLPYNTENIDLSSTKNTLKTKSFGIVSKFKIEQCFLHSRGPLPKNFQGSWINTEGLWLRPRPFAKESLIISKKNFPDYIPEQNLCIIANYCLSDGALPIPQTKQEWQDLFKIAHRKEIIATIAGRKFINDSAATIPQAMQLEFFNSNRLHVICGGTDKNLDAQDIINQLHFANGIYLLEGTFTQKIISLLQDKNITYYGPYNSLADAVEQAFKQSRPDDIIILSPGCASFGMFKHEFDRGNTFKESVKNLQNHHSD